MTITTDTPRVWIGCLACYNAGAIIGHWFDADGAGDVTVAEVHAGHFTSPEDVNAWRDAAHEELWVMDHDGFRGALEGECSPATAQALAEALESLDDSYIPWEAWVAYADNHGHLLALVGEWKDECEEAWNGEHSSREDFAQELAEELGMLKENPSWPYDHIDWDGAARDLFLGGDYWDADAPGGGIYVFRSL